MPGAKAFLSKALLSNAYEDNAALREDNAVLRDDNAALREKNDALREEIETLRSRREKTKACLLYTSPSPRDRQKSRMPSSA